ncbi:MAG: hypothetical protein IJZ44_08185 [Lachnospiraceae bacterium]|nr:hypothetical protein [Lachnospiraceae bacterium]
MAKREEEFKEALKGKKLPILTLDNKWHQLFTQHNQNKEVMRMAEELNELVAKQGGLNNDIKDIRKLKAKLMDEIVSGMDGKTLSDKEMEDHKRLINECNEKIEEKQDELLDIPRDIDRINYQLMLYTMEVCYDAIESNTEEITRIAEWIAQVRVELKKNVIRKQEKEWLNQEMYSYMHDIFGPDVIEIFDMKYDPAGSMLKKASDEPKKENE